MTVGLLAGMGIDSLSLLFHPLAEGESFKKHLFEATFLNASAPLAIASWVMVIALFWLTWSQGMRLKSLLKQYMPALDRLDDVTYRMIAIGCG
jgi:ABC-type uncharacterized transport system permease subunit